MPDEGTQLKQGFLKDFLELRDYQKKGHHFIFYFYRVYFGGKHPWNSFPYTI